MSLKDLTFNVSEYGVAEKTDGKYSVLEAVKNIILSRPGNFPMHPDIGVDLAKYEFEFLDDNTLSQIKTDIIRQVTENTTDVDDINIEVSKLEENINGQTVYGVGVAVSIIESGNEINRAFIILKDREVLSIYDEIN